MAKSRDARKDLKKKPGKSIKEKDVARAINLSMTRYCSASAMIKKTADVTAEYELTDTVTGDTVRGEVSFKA